MNKQAKKREQSGNMFIIPGALVLLVAVVMNFVSNSYRFSLFVVAGMGLIIYGVWIKLNRNPIKETAKKVHQQVNKHVNRALQNSHQNAKNMVQGQQNQQAQQAQQQHQKQQRASPFFFCPFCGNRIPPNARHCPTCGTRLV